MLCKITSSVFISKRYGIVDEKSPRADKNNKQTARKTKNNHFQTLISEIFPALEGASKIFSAFYLQQLYATVVGRRRKFVRSREFPPLCALLNGISSTKQFAPIFSIAITSSEQVSNEICKLDKLDSFAPWRGNGSSSVCCAGESSNCCAFISVCFALDC